MSEVVVEAMLWRALNKATYDSLDGKSAGQYDIRLTRAAEISEFFAGIAHEDPTDLEGFTLRVPFAAFEGENPVPAQFVEVRYMGTLSGRKDWYIPSQRPDTAYPLWRLARTGATTASIGHAFVAIFRDKSRTFHGRWLSEEDVEALTPEMRTALRSNEVGVRSFDRVHDETTAGGTLARALRESVNVLLYGPPATGKTHRINETVSALRVPMLSTAREHGALRLGGDYLKVVFVSFHQSFTYEEFMVSLRPDPRSERFFALTARFGVLLELAGHAIKPGNEALLVIDEINRGNVSKIFGEFITAIEPDKRLGQDGKLTDTTALLQLPYLESPIAFPPRLYTLATMNSVDESVAPLDAALRRRFKIIELAADVDELRHAFGLEDAWRDRGGGGDDVSAYRVRALRVLEVLNERITFFRGAHFALGQWYFAPLLNVASDDNARDAFLDVWWTRIVPQLEELFAAQPEQLQRVLSLRPSTSGDALSLVDPLPEDADLGARPALLKNTDPSGTIGYIDRLIGVAAPAVAAIEAEEPSEAAKDAIADSASAVGNEESKPPEDAGR